MDAIYAVCRWSFLKDETFGAVARRYRNHLPTDIQNGTDSIHFYGNRYNHLSLKYLEQQHMYDRSRQAKQFDISKHYTVPNQQESYSLYLPTRPDFLNFLCERWCDEEQLGGGFEDATKSVHGECTRYSWYSERCRCLGINTARGRHESHTTFHIQSSEGRCRMYYHSHI